MAVDANGRVLHSLHPAQVGKSVQGIPNFPGRIPFAQITTQLIYPTRSQGNTYLNLLEPMKAVAGTLMRHAEGILAWFDSRIANGLIEGINSLVQAAKAKARGYRTLRNLKAITYLVAGKLDLKLPT